MTTPTIPYIRKEFFFEDGKKIFDVGSVPRWGGSGFCVKRSWVGLLGGFLN